MNESRAVKRKVKRPRLLQMRLTEPEHRELADRARTMRLPLSTWARWYLLTGGGERT